MEFRKGAVIIGTAHDAAEYGQRPSTHVSFSGYMDFRKAVIKSISKQYHAVGRIAQLRRLINHTSNGQIVCLIVIERE